MNDRALQPPASGVRIAAAHVTGIGGRESNQDVLGERTVGTLSCFVVADGAGGHEGGATAARLVTDGVLQTFERNPGLGTEALNACILHAAAGVTRAKAEQPALASMHSTLALLLIDRDTARACWAHVGDTRVYLFRDGHVRHQTRDHSLAQQFIDAGLAKFTDPRRHAQRNVLYAAIGVEGETASSLQPAVDLLPGDALLVCTDGLWEHVTEEDMEDCLARVGSPADWLAALCARADGTAGHARDNYTAYAIWIAA